MTAGGFDEGEGEDECGERRDGRGLPPSFSPHVRADVTSQGDDLPF